MEQATDNELTQLKSEVSQSLRRANELEIKTEEDNAKAQGYVVCMASFRKRLHERFDPSVRQAHTAWLTTKSLYNSFVQPCDEYNKIVKRKICAFQEMIDRKRRDEARRLEAERKARERKREEELIAKAEVAETNGHTEKAEAYMESAEDTPPPAPSLPPVESPKVAGSSFREVWVGEITDMRTFCKAVANREVPPSLVTGDQASINSFAKTVKNSMTVQGLRIFPKKVMSARAVR